MNPADTLAPIALQVLLAGAVGLAVAHLACAWRRRRADPWRQLARRHRLPRQ